MKPQKNRYKPRRYLSRRRPYKTCQAAFIGSLIDYNGGAKPVAEALGITRARVLEWRNQGKVPLKMCPRVAKYYGVAPELLNYNDYLEFNVGIKPQATSWKELFSKMDVTKTIQTYVLSFPEP